MYHGLGRWEQEAVHSGKFVRVKRDFLPLSGGSEWAPCFVDLDGNGKRDILIGQNGAYVQWFEESEPGNLDFVEISEHLETIAHTSACNRLWFGDLDDDGTNDLIIGTSQRLMHRFIQRAQNSSEFDAAPSIAFSVLPKNYNAPCILDIDGDGRPELLTGGDDRKLSLYRQDAAVRDSFILVTDQWSGIDDISHGIVSIADIDGNGLLDAFIGSYDGELRRYEQPGANALDGWVLRDDNVLGLDDLGALTSGCVCDLEGDGRLDILRSFVHDERNAPRTNIRHYRQQSTGSLTLEYVGEITGPTIGAYEYFNAHDINGDGRLELVVTQLNGGLHLYSQDAADPTVFTLVKDTLAGLTFVFPPHPSFADIDGNGKLDMMLANSDRKIDRYEAETAGSDIFVLIEKEWRRSAEYYPALYFIDYDGDGLMDMIQGMQKGELRHWEQSGTGSASYIELTSPVSTIKGGAKAIPAVTDVNNDGRLDVIIIDGAGGVSLFVDDGPNTVTQPPLTETLHILGTTPHPFSGHASLNVLVDRPAQYSMCIYGMDGRVLRTPFALQFSVPGQYAIPLDLHAQPAGVYMVVIEGGNATVRHPVLHLK
jgi:hypothetical protein